MIRAIVPVIVLFSFLTVPGALIAQSSPTLTKIGPMFSGSYINVNIARESAMFSRGGYQYISYYDPEGHVVVARRKIGRKAFEKQRVPIAGGRVPLVPQTAGGRSLANPHNYISMQMDRDGFIHLAYGQHATGMNYLRGRRPYEIKNWTRPKAAFRGAAEGGVTYVSFFAAGGRLYCMFRKGWHGRGDQLLFVYDTAAKRWNPLQTPLLSGEGRASPYLWHPAVSPSGAIHLFWTWRLNEFESIEDNPILKRDFGGFTNTDIYYAKSNDGGETWSDSVGIPYSLPIRYGAAGEEVEVVADIPVGEDFFNHFGSDTDAYGRPYIVYTKREGAAPRAAQQWLTFWNNGVWNTRQVTSYRRRVTWTRQQQHGHAATDVARPSLAVSATGTVHVFSRSKENGNTFEVYSAAGPDYTSWSRRVLYPSSLGGWEPLYDAERYKTDGTLSFLILGVTDETVHEAYATDSARITSFGSMWREINKFFTALWNQIRKTTGYTDYYSEDLRVDILKVDSRINGHGHVLDVKLEDLRIW